MLKGLEKMRRVANHNKDRLEKSVTSTLSKYLSEKKYRADLKYVQRAKVASTGYQKVEVAYNKEFGFPTESDLMALVGEHAEGMEIDWPQVVVDTDAGLVNLSLRPSQNIIPVASAREIPPDFQPIGTALYRRKVDASGNVAEIWELRTTEGGLQLVRNTNDMHVVEQASEELKVGDAVSTPDGVGRIKRFDEVGNAVVAFGDRNRLVAADSMERYDVNKERKKLEEYYAEVYGDPAFAKELTEKMSGE